MYLCIYVIMYLWLCGLRGYVAVWLCVYLFWVYEIRKYMGGDKLNYVFRVYEIREYIGNLECFTAWTKRMWYAECGMRDER